jgi:ribosomal protein S18 acetylase RimI-like enzyme
MPINRRALSGDLDRFLEIVDGLPEFFTPDVPDKVRSDIARCESWVVVDDGVVLGFAIVDRRSPEVAEILWAAVQTERRGMGLGTTLVDGVLDSLKADGVLLVELKTLDKSAGYEPYKATISFWEGRGFIQIDVIDPLPGWQPGNPCAIYVARLSS